MRHAVEDHHLAGYRNIVELTGVGARYYVFLRRGGDDDDDDGDEDDVVCIQYVANKANLKRLPLAS